MKIFELIQLSKVDPAYCQNMLVASLYFWESTTNTFQLSCRIITLRLFDVAAIAGLQQTREVFDPNERNEDTINFNADQASFGHYMEDHHNKEGHIVSDEKHITFLALWLLRCILCCKSLKVAKKLQNY